MRRLVAPIAICFMFAGCSSQADAKSNLVFAMRHTISDRYVSLQLSQDRSYFILVDHENVEYKGVLTSADFEELSPHVSQAAIARLEDEVSRQSQGCDLDHDLQTYFLEFVGGGGCLLPTQFTDEQARKDFEYLLSVFDQKAEEHGIR